MNKSLDVTSESNNNEVIDFDRYKSIVDLFQQSVETYRNKVAYINNNKALTYNELDKLSRNFSAYLQKTFKVKKGQRIGLMCPNNLPFVIAMWGVIRAGGVQVNINPLYTPFELEHQLNDAQVEIIIIISSSMPTLAKIIENTRISKVIVINPNDLLNVTHGYLKKAVPFSHTLEAGEFLSFTPPLLTQNDLLFLQYTGGTTGLSKGAMLTHGNLIANILQFEKHCNAYIQRGEEVLITAIPMYHIFALMVNTIAYFSFGAKNVLITNPQDMSNFIKIWQAMRVTFFTGVNTLFNRLLHTAGFDEIDFSSLKLAVGGGAPVQEAVAKKWLKVTGNPLSEGYGLSETSPILSVNIKTIESTITGIGVPLPLTKISIRDDFEQEVAQGEICVKGPQVMLGYWQNSAATDEAMTFDGYFKTGDIGMMDNGGNFHIIDRKKDMILVSGFNVYPNEIEAVIADLDGVVESGCIGVPHDKSGEEVKVFVVRSNLKITERMVINFCYERLVAYKVPKTVVFVESLPKSNVGKLLRKELINL